MKSWGVPVALAFLGCEGGLVTQAAPRSEARDTGHWLEVRVMVDQAHDSLAAVLGWSAGVPKARVMVLRNGTARWDTLTTDSLGQVRVTLDAGLYRIFAERFFTPDENSIAGRARAFGDGRTVELIGTTTVYLALKVDEPGSLVISEVGMGTPPPWETNGSYFGGLFFEVFNNGAETRYLDGMIFGAAGTPYIFSFPTPCHATEVTRTDSLGIYVREALAFPGSGADYPIGPGETRVVAWQAIDHRPAHPTLLDLSDADFEVAGAGAADNPDVPNMENVGLTSFAPQNLLSARVYFLASPLDPRTLPVTFRDGLGQAYIRVPREALEDVAALRHLWPIRDAENPQCVPMTSRVLHRYEGGFREIGFEMDPQAQAVIGYQRRALRRTSDGRVVLFDTNTSAVDFETALKTPGWVPEPIP